MLPQQPELSAPSVVGLLLVALVVNLVSVLLVVGLTNRYLRGRSRTTALADGDRRTSDPTVGAASDASDRSRVRCPACGTANDPEFRYCRDCVARLPGGGGADRSGLSSFGRFAN